ncbi:MAG: tetratricopeptide repeat protein [Mariprofundaceae bacterium]|nr:tetratricopeptide repeat protein [Mariprofundaceae bacterium]
MKWLKWMGAGLLCLTFFCVNAQASEDLSQKARAALSAGHVSEAADLLHQQVKKNPRDYQAWFLLGVSQAKIQRYHPAIESFRRVIELRSDLAEPHNNLAVIYNELGDVPAAIIELEASLKKHPSYLIAEENIADLYVKMALSYYKKALEKTDDKSLQVRYTRLLQVRDPAPLGESSVATTMVAKNTPVKPSENSVPVNSRMQKPAMPTVDSTSIQISGSKQPQMKTMLASLTEVKGAVEAWRKAWQSQNLPDYFAAYADDHLVPSRFKNQSTWEAYKARVIGNKKFITVMLTHVQIALTDDRSHAQVTFEQAFRSNTYNGDNKKRLILKQVNGVWKIMNEETL